MPKALSAKCPNTQPTQVAAGITKASEVYSPTSAVNGFLRPTNLSVVDGG